VKDLSGHQPAEKPRKLKPGIVAGMLGEAAIGEFGLFFLNRAEGGDHGRRRWAHRTVTLKFDGPGHELKLPIFLEESCGVADGVLAGQRRHPWGVSKAKGPGQDSKLPVNYPRCRLDRTLRFPRGVDNFGVSSTQGGIDRALLQKVGRFRGDGATLLCVRPSPAHVRACGWSRAGTGGKLTRENPRKERDERSRVWCFQE
jgi:hypothetical protein